MLINEYYPVNRY